MPEAPVIVVTGERGVGKTTLCRKIAVEAARRGVTVAGLATERLSDGSESPRRVIDLASGQCRPFGSRPVAPAPGPAPGAAPLPATEAPASPSAHETGPADPLTPGWEYDAGVFAWANDVLSRSACCDLLVIDEVGPLELRGGRGWIRALDVLRGGRFGVALVVCRPELLTELSDRLGAQACRVVRVEPETRDPLAPSILDELLRGMRGRQGMR